MYEGDKSGKLWWNTVSPAFGFRQSALMFHEFEEGNQAVYVSATLTKEMEHSERL